MQESCDNFLMGLFSISEASFSRGPGVTIPGVKEYFEPLHKTVLEFAAAYFLKTIAVAGNDTNYFYQAVTELKVRYLIL